MIALMVLATVPSLLKSLGMNLPAICAKTASGKAFSLANNSCWDWVKSAAVRAVAVPMTMATTIKITDNVFMPSLLSSLASSNNYQKNKHLIIDVKLN